jgi:2-keto-4-pentenoate hydratase/2-oxohepta-3-ene-1,7-dioic acid hydratase in catechol pathway
VGHGSDIVLPDVSDQLEYEREVAAIVVLGGRAIARQDALEHVAGYALFNDAPIRDYQTRSGQWTVRKNLDATGGFGPELVTADELPAGARGLQIQTRLNGQIMNCASTSEMIVDVAALIQILSGVIPLEKGDVIVTGTPAGDGLASTPK